MFFKRFQDLSYSVVHLQYKIPIRIGPAFSFEIVSWEYRSVWGRKGEIKKKGLICFVSYMSINKANCFLGQNGKYFLMYKIIAG